MKTPLEVAEHNILVAFDVWNRIMESPTRNIKKWNQAERNLEQAQAEYMKLKAKQKVKR